MELSPIGFFNGNNQSNKECDFAQERYNNLCNLFCKKYVHNFYLDNSLYLNITFLLMDFVGFPVCKYGKEFIRINKEQYFCGHHSVFTYYPNINNITIKIQTHDFQFDLKTKFKLFYQVHSGIFFVNSTPQNINAANNRLYYSITMNKMSADVLQVRVHNLYRARIHLKLTRKKSMHIKTCPSPNYDNLYCSIMEFNGDKLENFTITSSLFYLAIILSYMHDDRKYFSIMHDRVINNNSVVKIAKIESQHIFIPSSPLCSNKIWYFMHYNY